LAQIIRARAAASALGVCLVQASAPQVW